MAPALRLDDLFVDPELGEVDCHTVGAGAHDDAPYLYRASARKRNYAADIAPHIGKPPIGNWRITKAAFGAVHDLKGFSTDGKTGSIRRAIIDALEATALLEAHGAQGTPPTRRSLGPADLTRELTADLTADPRSDLTTNLTTNLTADLTADLAA